MIEIHVRKVKQGRSPLANYPGPAWWWTYFFVDPEGTRVGGYSSKGETADLVRKVWRGEDRVLVVWPDGRHQTVRPYHLPE